MAKTFNVGNTTVAQLLAPKDESVIFACTSCAEEEFQIMTEDREKEQGGGGGGEPQMQGGEGKSAEEGDDGEPENEGEEEELDSGLDEILKL